MAGIPSAGSAVTVTPTMATAEQLADDRFIRDVLDTPGLKTTMSNESIIGIGRGMCDVMADQHFSRTDLIAQLGTSKLGPAVTEVVLDAAHQHLCPEYGFPAASKNSSGSNTASTPAPASTPVTGQFTYKVTGKNPALITYATSGGNISQETSAKLPWSKTVQSPGYPGMTFAHVSAQNSGGGTISCQIIGPSGNVVADNSSEGDYAIVTCQS